MSRTFEELRVLARTDARQFAEVTRQECLAATRQFSVEQREEIRRRHQAGESGGNVMRMLTDLADNILLGVFEFGLAQLANPRVILTRVALVALGGYGRAQLSPHSDLDVFLLYDGVLDDPLKKLNSFLMPFLWDVGFTVGYAIRSVDEVMALAHDDYKVFTSLLESRLLVGDNTVYARLRLQVRDMRYSDVAERFVQDRVTERLRALPPELADVYRPDPDLKENAGGLRDYHTALWLLMIRHGEVGLDDVVGLGLITPEEHLDIVQALDFIWRVRNELHFNTNKAENRLTFSLQQHVARAFGYGPEKGSKISRLMEDYYAAARTLREFLNAVVRLHRYAPPAVVEDADRQGPAFVIENGELHVGHGDKQWFDERPSRLMEVFWRSARYGAPLSHVTEMQVRNHLYLVNDIFRSNDLVRRYFVAICNRPTQAGSALRAMARTGLLGLYLPEFKAIQGIIRYEDFHHYPVDEHTLRALEALGKIGEMAGRVGLCLQEALEHLSDPYILVMAVLFHDLGKAAGEVHTDEGVRITHEICRRIGLPEEDEERIVSLVEHHMLMTHISQYRDIEEEDIVRSFARTVKTDMRLRALFLLSYADLSAVGPNVWNDWKGSLLQRLYMKAERILLGNVYASVEEQDFWKWPKTGDIRALVSPELADTVEDYLRAMGERYCVAFTAPEIAAHIQCLDDAYQAGFAIRCIPSENPEFSELVVCTRDRQGLFAVITGSLASELIDVNRAALFTRPDGWVVDCFTVTDANRQCAITQPQLAAIEKVLRAALLDNADVRQHVERSRRRLFALLQPRIPIVTGISFDNESSRTHTVIDVETGDRTGLLYDITCAMTEAGLDIASARIVTDARRIRDSFYVTCAHGKLEEQEEQDGVRECLHRAIHPTSAIEPKGEVS